MQYERPFGACHWCGFVGDFVREFERPTSRKVIIRRCTTPTCRLYEQLYQHPAEELGKA